MIIDDTVLCLRRRSKRITGSAAELRYTFHKIYVGILDTVTTATIQLFGSHGRFVLIGAPWAYDRAYICRRKRRHKTQSSVWDASQAPPRFVERERSIDRGARPGPTKRRWTEPSFHFPLWRSYQRRMACYPGQPSTLQQPGAAAMDLHDGESVQRHDRVI